MFMDLSYDYSPFSIFALSSARASRSPRVVLAATLLITGVDSFLAVLCLRGALTSSLAVSNVRLCERMIRFVSLTNSITLNSSSSPSCACVPSYLTRCLGVAKPSPPSLRVITAPLSIISVILPVCTEPGV